MTTNELKCFCGAVVDKYEGWVDGKISLMSCTNPDCWMHGDTQPEIFEKIQHQIKSVIDKEKAAAVQVTVQQERERVEGLIEGQLTNAQEGAGNYPEGSKAQFASAKLVNTLQWLRDKISEGRIDENSN